MRNVVSIGRLQGGRDNGEKGMIDAHKKNKKKLLGADLVRRVSMYCDTSTV